VTAAPLPPLVFPDAMALADAAARTVRDVAARAIAEHGRFRVAFPGGRTPGRLLAALAAPPIAGQVDWPRVEVFLADERALPPGDPERNDRLVLDSLVAPLGDHAPRIHPMAAESADLEAAAARYAALLVEPLDLVVLGMGEDGHVASLFPGSPLLAEHERRVVVVRDSPKPPPCRLTLTPRTLAEARAVLVLVTGRAKHAAAQAALASEGTVTATPARLARHGAWLFDAEAALGETP
jgi:6-phosphogluconolactonase